MRKQLMIATFALASITTNLSHAVEHEVLMLNKGEKGGMVYQPDFIKAAPGDTIKFIPTDKGHNVESIKGMIPDGVKKFRSKFNKEYILEPKVDGLYGIKCTPHYGLGMVALIAVGEPVNEESALAVRQWGKAKKRFADIIKEYQASK